MKLNWDEVTQLATKQIIGFEYETNKRGIEFSGEMKGNWEEWKLNYLVREKERRRGSVDWKG